MRFSLFPRIRDRVHTQKQKVSATQAFLYYALRQQGKTMLTSTALQNSGCNGELQALFSMEEEKQYTVWHTNDWEQEKHTESRGTPAMHH